MTSLLVSPASRYEASDLPDLGSSDTRRRLTPAAVRGVLRLSEQWDLTADEVTRLLGDISHSTWFSWKSGKLPADLGTDRLMRISLLLGIFTALRAQHTRALADRWVKLPNKNMLFGGGAPIEFMTHGGIPALVAVRALLDGRRGGL